MKTFPRCIDLMAVSLVLLGAVTLLAGCASAPSELKTETTITVVYRQGALPSTVQLQGGGGPAGGLVGALIDQATEEKNIGNRSRLDAMNAKNNGQQLQAAFKQTFAQALREKGLQTTEVPSKGGARTDVKTHVPSFDREAVKTKWVIQIDEVQANYNASSAFASYKPWVWVKFALFDMRDNSLTPIVPLTPANFGSDEKYHYKNSQALAAASPEELLAGLEITVKAAALDAAQRIRP